MRNLQFFYHVDKNSLLITVLSHVDTVKHQLICMLRCILILPSKIRLDLFLGPSNQNSIFEGRKESSTILVNSKAACFYNKQFHFVSVNLLFSHRTPPLFIRLCGKADESHKLLIQCNRPQIAFPRTGFLGSNIKLINL